ncbi:MAG TPA: hypothetical protein VMK05_02235 [Burkholderiales bacterium]|nr:hypothetical protein [Burkholderiales bacterium]
MTQARSTRHGLAAGAAAVLIGAGLLACAQRAHAWSYLVIDRGDQQKFLAQPPDLTYPPAGMPMPVLAAGESALAKAVPLAPDQERARLNRDQLIIIDQPIPHASGWMFSVGRTDASVNGQR